MPHISVKMFAGRDDATKELLARTLQDDLARILNSGKEHISVSVEDFTLETWGDVYDSEIHDNPHVLIPSTYDWDSEYLRMTGKPRQKN